MIKNFHAIGKKAFTVAELLIALGVIGILTAVLMPIVLHIIPDQNALMAKRAYHTTEAVISDLLNDPYCYPKTLSRVGLDDGLGYRKCKKWGGEENTGSLTNDKNYSKKLVTLFADKLDTTGNIYNNYTTFKTKDGMIWRFSDFDMSSHAPTDSVLLTVDMNGDKGPNCGQSSTSGQCANGTKNKDFDRFTMKIYARGRIQLLDCWAVKAIRVDKKMVGKEEAINCGSTEAPVTDAPTAD